MTAAPTPVVLVYPKLTKQTRWIKFFVTWAIIFATAFLLMLVLPGAIGFAPGYWQTFLLVLALRFSGLTNFGQGNFFAPTVGSLER